MSELQPDRKNGDYTLVALGRDRKKMETQAWRVEAGSNHNAYQIAIQQILSLSLAPARVTTKQIASVNGSTITA